jgi:predicted transcriptional regulator of viral defense system
MSRSSPTTATKSRLRLSQVLQQAGDLVSVNDVSQTLQMERTSAAKQLARWHLQGLLRRLRRGVYAPVPLTALGQEQVLEDPWVVVPELFGPAYIGGWSAAEHWGLTEQLFRSVCVVTARQVRGKEQTVQGVPFVLKRARRSHVWNERRVARTGEGRCVRSG